MIFRFISKVLQKCSNSPKILSTEIKDLWWRDELNKDRHFFWSFVWKQPQKVQNPVSTEPPVQLSSTFHHRSRPDHCGNFEFNNCHRFFSNIVSAFVTVYVFSASFLKLLLVFLFFFHQIFFKITVLSAKKSFKICPNLVKNACILPFWA